MNTVNITDNYRKHTSKNPLQRYLINRFFKTFIKEVKAIHPKMILDVGCGEGFTLNHLRKQNIGKDLVGIDTSQIAVTLGRKAHPYLDLRVGDAYKLPFKDNTFDLVTCLEVLEHLEHPEKVLRELVRVSKKYCIVSVPNEPWFKLANLLRGKNIKRFGNDIEHIQHWSVKSFKKFTGRQMHIVTVKKPLPWMMLVGVK